ncbi:MAG: hypothetical protein M3Q07_19335, partial [Pseudobdellovibrionaceae bacterium]|nr:hypothetical protein [Pseudobdellovibrionaceae bacterium]
MSYQTLFVSFLLLSPVVGYSEGYLKCEKYGTLLKKCTVDQTKKIADPIQGMESESNEESDFVIDYSFVCPGDNIDIYFRSGDGQVLITKGQKNRLTVTGTYELIVFDPNPQITKRKHFENTCDLIVDKVDIQPSTRQISLWNNEAITHAKIIGLASDRFALANDFGSYANWDKNQTNVMLESMRLKVKLFEEGCESGDQTSCRSAAHFRVAVGALEAKITGTPSSEITGDASDEITATYLEDLETEIQTGERMINRFKHWHLEISRDLEEIIQKVR